MAEEQLGSRPKHWMRTVDHPAAFDRNPESAAKQWNVDFEADDGCLYRVHVGEVSRQEMLRMLSDESTMLFPLSEKTVLQEIPATLTTDQIRNAITKARIYKIDHHDCAICGYMTAYHIRSMQLFYDAGCNCVADRSGWQRQEFDELAEWYNMQTDIPARKALLESFGMELANT